MTPAPAPAPAGPVLDPPRLGRPAVRTLPGRVPGRTRAAAGLVGRLAALHAAATRGRLVRRAVSALDVACPADLPDLVATLPGGARLRLDGGGALARITLLHQGYEQRECELLVDAVRPGGVFVDVGANVGWFALTVATHRPAGAVWALEPVPETADALAANVAAAGLDAVVAVHRVAAGAGPGSVELVRTADPAFAHAVGAGTARPAGAGLGVAVCPVDPVDAIWAAAGRPRVDALKVDVEGTEVAVLAGAREVLLRCRPLVVAEAATAAEAAAVLAAVAGLGYVRATCPGVYPYNLVLVPAEGGPVPAGRPS